MMTMEGGAMAVGAKPGFADLAQRAGLSTHMAPGLASSPVANPAASLVDDAAEKAWAMVSASLRTELGADLFASWIAPARLICTRAPGGATAITVVTHTETALGWIKRNAWRQMSALWGLNDAGQRTLALMSRAEAAGVAQVAQTQPAPVTMLAQPAAPVAAISTPATQADEPARATGLQDRFTFDTSSRRPPTSSPCRWRRRWRVGRTAVSTRCWSTAPTASARPTF